MIWNMYFLQIQVEVDAKAEEEKEAKEDDKKSKKKKRKRRSIFHAYIYSNYSNAKFREFFNCRDFFRNRL